MTPDKVFYIPGQRNALDYATARADGQMVAAFDGRTLEQLRAEYPGVRVVSESDFARMRPDAPSQ